MLNVATLHEALNRGARDYVYKDVTPVKAYGELPAFFIHLAVKIEIILRWKPVYADAQLTWGIFQKGQIWGWR